MSYCSSGLALAELSLSARDSSPIESVEATEIFKQSFRELLSIAYESPRGYISCHILNLEIHFHTALRMPGANRFTTFIQGDKLFG